MNLVRKTRFFWKKWGFHFGSQCKTHVSRTKGGVALIVSKIRDVCKSLFRQPELLPPAGSLNKHVFLNVFDWWRLGIHTLQISKSMHGWGHLNMNNFNRTLMETFSHTPLIYVSTCCLECMFFCWRFLGGFKLKSSSMTWMSRGIRRSLHESFAPASSKWPENSLPFNGGHLLNFTPEEVTPTPPNFVSLGRIWWALDKNLWFLALDVRSRNGTSSLAASAVVAPRLGAPSPGLVGSTLFFTDVPHSCWGTQLAGDQQDAPSCIQLPEMFPKHIFLGDVSRLRT